MEKGVLSDLCTTCHTEKPKYRCPGCKTQTCSLSCYKRHQQRASCSGKRDPTAFVKKSQWATPTGVDHDYNYLKSVERTIEDANQSAHQRGIGVESIPSSKGVAKAWRPDSGLQRYLSKHRITVDHAPVGMTRQKANQTRISKQGKVLWTLEWADSSGRRHLQNDCQESLSLAQLYSVHQAEMRNIERRRSTPEQRGTKRKRGNLKEKVQTGLEDGLTLDLLEDGAAIMLNSAGFANSDPPIEGEGDPNSGDVDAKVDQHEGDADGSSSEVEFILDAEAKPSATPQISTSRRISHTHLPLTVAKRDQHFYLLRPGTNSRSRVLIPLEHDNTLTTSMEGKTLQEYPTIYALAEGPEALPSDFMLEKDYLQLHREASNANTVVGEKDALAAYGTRDAVGPSTDERTGQVNANTILEMLRRDVAV